MGGEAREERLPDEALARLTVLATSGSAHGLANALGIAPDEHWNAGEIGKRGKRIETTGVSFVSQVEAQRAPTEHLADLLTRIEPLGEALERQMAMGNSVQLKLAVFADTDNPMFTLPAALLRRLSALNLDLVIDIYEV